MVNWGKRPEFNTANIPRWRKRLDYGLLALGLTLTAYNALYLAVGMYLGEIDHEKERRDFREMDDRINRFIYGKSLYQISPALQRAHESVSLIELAEQIRQRQQQQESGDQNITVKEVNQAMSSTNSNQ